MKYNNVKSLIGAFLVLAFLMTGAGGCSSSIGSAKRQMKKGNNKKAIELLEDGIAGGDADNPQAYALLAKAYYSESQYIKASEFIGKARKLGLSKVDSKDMTTLFNATWSIITNNAILSYNKALSFIRSGQKNMAKAQIDTATINAKASVNIYPDSSVGYSILANIYVIEESYKEAASVLEKAIKVDPKNVQNYIQLSNIYSQYMSKSDSTYGDKAIEVLETAKTATEETPELVKQLTIAYVSNGRAAEAEALAEKLAAQESDDKYSHFLYGVALGENEKYDKSLSSYKTALEIDPNFEQAVYNFAYISYLKAEKQYEENGKGDYTDHYFILDEAINILKPLAEEKNSPDYWDLLGSIYAKKGDNEKAESASAKANQLREGSGQENAAETETKE